LTTHGVNIDCRYLNAILKDQEDRELCSYGERLGKEYSVILIVKASKLLRQGCIEYLSYDTEVKEEEMKIEDIPVVCEFHNVFPEELAGLTPQREIDFGIELIFGAHPILKAPYRMAPIELKELKS